MSEAQQRTRWPWARPPQLGVLVAYNGLAQIAPIVVTLALTPLLLHRLGLDQFGIWSLALVIMNTLGGLDGGVSASLDRFFAMYQARSDRASAGRLVVASVAFFAGLGFVFTLVMLPLAPIIVPVLHIPRSLHGETVLVLRWLPAVVALELISGATCALLQGNGQFRELAASTILSSAVFAIMVVAFVRPGASLRELMVATAVRYVVLAVCALLCGLRHIAVKPPLLPARTTFRELWRYSSRMQLSALTGLVNDELDAFVIAAFLPIRYVALYGIGMQAASAARSLPLYAFPPLLTRLAGMFGGHGREATVSEFVRLERWWLPTVLAYGAVAVAGIGFSVTVWLGNRYRLAAFVAVILLTGYTVHVALTGMRTCCVRAIGQPGLETRYSAVWMFVNTLLTIPFVLVWGLIGVVSATALSGVFASLYFVLLCRRRERLEILVPSARWSARAVLAGLVTVAGELLVLQSGLRGFPALVLSAVPGLVALLTVGVRAWRAPALRVAS